MKKRRLLCVLLGIVVLTGSVVGVGALVRLQRGVQEEVALLDLSARGEEAYYSITLKEYSEEKDLTHQYSMSDQEEARRFLAYLNALEWEPVKSAKERDITSNVVEIEIRDFPEFVTYITWQDGYWINDRGYTYQVALDLQEILDTFGWRKLNTIEGDHTNNRYHQAVNGGEWIAELLTVSEEPEENDLTMEVTDQSGRVLTVEMTNRGTQRLMCDENYGIQVKLDGVWYDVPEGYLYYAVLRMPCWVEPDNPLVKKFDLGEWGAWPAGEYRIVVNGVAAEFYWQGDMENYLDEAPDMLLVDHSGMIESESLTFTTEYENYPPGTEEIYYFMENDGERKMYYGHTVGIEVFRDGQWYSLPYNHRAFFVSTLQQLKPGDQDVRSIPLYMYDYDFPAGKYRMVFEYCHHDYKPSEGRGYDHVACVEFELCEDSSMPVFSDIREQSMEPGPAMAEGCVVLQDGQYQNLGQVVAFFEKREVRIPCQMRIVNLDEKMVIDVKYKNFGSWGDYEVTTWDGKQVETQTYEYLQVEQEDATQIILSNNRNMESSELALEYYIWNETVILSEKADEESVELGQILELAPESDRNLRDYQAKRREMVVYNQMGDMRGVLAYDLSDDPSDPRISLRIEDNEYRTLVNAHYSVEEAHPVYLFAIGEQDIGVAFLHANGLFQGRRYDRATGEVTARISMCETLEEVMDALSDQS